MKRSTHSLTKSTKPALVRPPAPHEIYAALIEICRRDFYSFAMLCMAELNPGDKPLHNYHLEALAFRLSEVQRGKCRNLMVNMPPRCGKSIFTSIAFPAYVLGLDPTRRLIVLSHSLGLAAKLSNDFRKIVNSDWYKAIFPQTKISRKKNTESEVHTTKGGYRRAASLHGSLTGLGGHYLIFDDPLNAADAYSDTKRKRVNELVRDALIRLDDKQNGATIIAMQRLHADDPCGNLLDAPNNKWSLLSLPAIAEEDETIQIGENRVHQRRAGTALHEAHEPLTTLQESKSQRGLATFSAQYQQRPMPRDGLIFKRDWLQWYDVLPARKLGSQVVQSWDTAIKSGANNDFAVCVTVMIGDDKFYVVDIVRKHLEFPDLVKLAKSLAATYNPGRILVEDAGTGSWLVQDLARSGLPAIAVKPQRDKVTRMQALSIKFEQGQVFLPRQALWLEEFLAELLSVPNARHDDQVDSLCQALAYMGDSSRRYWDAITSKNFNNFLEGMAFDRWVQTLS